MTGTGSNNQSFVVTIAFAALPPGPFPIGGATTARSEETITFVSAGQTSAGTITYYFEPTSAAFFGAAADGACSIGTSNTALPTEAAIGASGSLFNESDLDGCASNSVALGTSASTWSIVADSGVALLCWNLISSDLAGTQNGSESICLEIAVDGTLGTKARFAINSAGLAISARNF